MSVFRLVVVAVVMTQIVIFGMGKSSAVAANGDQVTMRAFLDDDGGAQLIIEWSAPIKVLQKRDEASLTLRFSRSLSADAKATFDLLTAFLDIERTVIEGTDLRLTLKPGVSAALELKEHRIVAITFDRQSLELYDAELNVATISNGVRLSLAWQKPVNVDSRKQEGHLFLTIAAMNRVRPADIDFLNGNLRPWFSVVRQTTVRDGTSLAFDLQPMITSNVTTIGDNGIEIEFRRDASMRRENQAQQTTDMNSSPSDQRVAPPSADEPPPLPKPRPRLQDRLLLTEKAGTGEANVPEPSEAKVDELVFDWAHSVGAAVFKRSGYLWVVFDALPSFSKTALPPPAPQPLLPGELLDAEGATVVRYPLAADTDIVVQNDQTGRWIIRPAEAPAKIDPIALTPSSNASILRAVAASNVRIVEVEDPLVGDQLGIWPVLEVGSGQDTARRFVDIAVLESVQGLIWRPLNDQVAAEVSSDGLTFRRAGGLRLSNSLPAGERVLDDGISIPDIGESSKNRGSKQADMKKSGDAPRLLTKEAPSSYLAFANSNVARELVAETRRVLRQAIRRAPPEGKDQARLNLAKLLVAEKLASEAKIVLSTISRAADDSIDTTAHALRGASAFLTSDLEEASDLLRASRLDDDKEIGLWRAALDARERKWETAAEGWKTFDNQLDAYPVKLRLELGLLALESAIETNDSDMIRKGIRRLRSLRLAPIERAKVDRLRALAALRNGDQQKAEAILKRLVKSRYPSVSALAEFELQSLNTDDDPNAQERLADLREHLPLWRGHPQEIGMVDRLARGHRMANQPREALRLWEYLSRVHPETEDDADIMAARRDTYIDAITRLAGQDIDLLEAYTIYLDFIDLLPDDLGTGSVHRDLAKHLAGLDLLDEAILVLKPIFDGTEEQDERLEIGMEIASHLLILDRPQEALLTLERIDALPQDQADRSENERRVLKALALAQLDRGEEALRQIRDLQTSAARQARAEIFWEQRNWNRLASSIEAILEDPELSRPLSEENQKFVLWLALAREALGQTSRLGELRQEYGEEMRSGPWHEAFMIGTQRQTRTADIQTALERAEDQLDELSQFRAASN